LAIELRNCAGEILPALLQVIKLRASSGRRLP